MFYASAMPDLPKYRLEKNDTKTNPKETGTSTVRAYLTTAAKIYLAPVQEDQIQTPGTIFFPHFQTSATRPDWKQGTETAAELPPSRECTKKPISALPNIGSMETF